jgi:hypothetical protein
VDIPFPSQLQWVTPLVGSHWPAGSESAWWRTAGYLRDTASELEAQIPDLTKVRSKTHVVLVGETAQAFEQQTAQLFSGNTAVDKKVEALRSLGDAAESLGTEIQYSKLSIYSMLVIAAASIVFALANSEWTLGASLAQIPVIRWLTENAMARLVTMVLGRIEAELAARLGSMLVARLVVEGVVSAGIGAAQEGGIEAIQVAEGHRDGIDVGTVVHSALSMGTAGVAGGLVGHAVGGLVGTEGNTAMRALKSAVTGLASAEAANLAGTLAGGGHIGADTFLGGAIGLVHGGLHGGADEHGAPVQDPTETPMPANAIDTHPTLRFERVEQQPDGTTTFAWPGDQTGAVHDPSASTSDGAPQAIAARPTTSAADPAGAAGDRGASSNGSPGAADPGARSSGGSTAVATSAHGDGAGASPRSLNETPPALDTAASPADHLTAGVDPAPATNAPLNAGGPPEGRLDLSSSAPPVSVGPVAYAGSTAVSDLVGQSGGLGSPAGSPDMARGAAPDPSSIPPASSDHGPSLGSSSPTPDTRAGLTEPSSAAAESAAQPAGAPAARTSDTTAAQARPGTPHGDFERVEAGQAGASVVERSAPRIGPESATTGQAGRSGVDAHLVGRGEGARVDSGRTADPVTTRRDPARPDSGRDDSNRPGGARPGKLPRRSGVARDTPEDLQPAAIRAPDPLAAAEDIGIIKASHGDSGPDPGEPESHKGGRDGGDGHNTPDPGTAGGGDGGHRGGAGGRGGGRGGAGLGGAEPSDDGRDGDSHPAERSGQPGNRPSGSDPGGGEQAHPPTVEGSARGGSESHQRGDDGSDSRDQHADGASGDAQTPGGGGGGDHTSPDGDSHPVEDYFQNRWRPPSDEAVSAQPPVQSAYHVAEALREIYGREIGLESGQAEDGMYRDLYRSLCRAVGSNTDHATFAETGETVRYLGRDSSAIVFAQRPGEDWARYFLAVNIDDMVHYYDPASRALLPWPPPWREVTEWRGLPIHPQIVYLDERGYPVRRFDGLDLRWADISFWRADLPEADRLQLEAEKAAVDADFASAMNRRVQPSSPEANELAERHIDITRRFFTDDVRRFFTDNMRDTTWVYRLHRYLGGLLVTDAALRNPYEWIAPGLARYVYEAILGNAERHLG